MLNLRQRLWKNFRKRPTLDLKLRIKHLNIEIGNYFYSQKQQNIRKQRERRRGTHCNPKGF